MAYDIFKIKVDSIARPMRNGKYMEAACEAADKGVVRVPVWNYIKQEVDANGGFVITATANPKWITNCDQVYVLDQYAKFLAEKNRG